MVLEIYKDYSVSEIACLAEQHPKRYENLCKIVGEFHLGVRPLRLGIVLPYESDKGCVVAHSINKDIIEVIDTRYF